MNPLEWHKQKKKREQEENRKIGEEILEWRKQQSDIIKELEQLVPNVKFDIASLYSVWEDTPEKLEIGYDGLITINRKKVEVKQL